MYISTIQGLLDISGCFEHASLDNRKLCLIFIKDDTTSCITSLFKHKLPYYPERSLAEYVDIRDELFYDNSKCYYALFVIDNDVYEHNLNLCRKLHNVQDYGHWFCVVDDDD